MLFFLFVGQELSLQPDDVCQGHRDQKEEHGVLLKIVWSTLKELLWAVQLYYLI